jgi:Trypsin-like peptidase domain
MKRSTMLYCLALVLLTAAAAHAVFADSADGEEVTSHPAPQVQLHAPGTAAGVVVDLPAPSAAALPKSKAGGASNQPEQVGLGRPFPPELSRELTPAQLGWMTTADKGHVAVLSITSEDAQGVRVAIEPFSIPNEAQLRFFSGDGTQGGIIGVTGAEINASLARDAAARDADAPGPLLYWGPAEYGPTAKIEIYLPAGIDVGTFRIAIWGVSHIYEMPPDMTSVGGPQAKLGIGSCTVNASCYPDWGDVEAAVARMIFTTDTGLTAACSGSLIADKNPSSQIPYFITARHCISTQAVASTLQTYWTFRTSSCDGTVDPSQFKIVTGGSTLLATLSDVDISLVKLNGVPPTGATMVGWDAEYAPRGSSIGSVSHPQGDFMKVAFGDITGYVDCYFASADSIQGCGATPGDAGNFLVAAFQTGMPQQGSSGSGVFLAGSHKLVGIYSTVAWLDNDGDGTVSCGDTVLQNNYGRFDIAYQESLKQWLGTRTACTLDPGDWAYCSDPACGPCAEGQGDCDSDQECRPGLVCAQDVGAKYGWDPTMDVCEQPGSGQPSSLCTLQPGDWGYCSDPNCGPCDAGLGDCNSDSECQPGLVCLKGTGAEHGFAPSVDTCGPASARKCTLTKGDWNYCADPNCGPCGQGEGDCDSDEECRPGLVCSSNVGAKYGLLPTMDVCELPASTICRKSPGDWDYCADPACGPCQAGQGDCDSDAECGSGLYCALNVGEKYGLPPTMDVCEPRQP